MTNGKNGEGTHSTKIGSDSSAAKCPHMPQHLSSQFVCANQKGWYFDEKGFIGRP